MRTISINLVTNFIAAMLLAFLTCNQIRANQIELVHKTTVSEKALTFASGSAARWANTVNGRTHQQTPLTTYRGYQYVTYFDAQRRVCLGRRKLPAGKWDVIQFKDHKFKTNDSHNTSVIGICEKDGTIHMAFDHHASQLNYRVSKLGVAHNPDSVQWNADLFGDVTHTLGSVEPADQVTYPRFFSTPNGNLMLYYRAITSGNGDGMIEEYDGDAHNWTPGLGKFISRDIGTYTFRGKTSLYRCPYINSLSYAGDRLHVSWVWRDRFEKTNPSNQHDLCYAYSDDDGRTWHNSNGELIGTTGAEGIHLNSPGVVVVPIASGSGLTNSNTHFAYPDGSLHVVMRCRFERATESRYYHYWRSKAGKWSSEALPFTGSRPKLVGSSDHSLTLVYSDEDDDEKEWLHIARGLPNPEKTAWSWQAETIPNPISTCSEPLVDLARWNSDETLSVYLQETPDKKIRTNKVIPVDGIPSPLHVIDYRITDQDKPNIGGKAKSTLVRPPAGRLAIVADGNSPDPDDIGATAVMFGLLKATDLNERLVHLSHCCDLKPTPRIAADDELRRQKVLDQVCRAGVAKFGPFANLANFFNCRTEQTAAVDNLRDAINQSTKADPLWIIEAGEPDIIGFALKAADVSKRQFVHVVSHHPANDNAGDFFSWKQILDFGIQEHQIGDQNIGLQSKTQAWGWAKGHSDARMNWIWKQLAYAEQDGVVKFQTNKFDCSDAGMIYWWITGADDGGNKHSTHKDIMAMLTRYGTRSDLLADTPLADDFRSPPNSAKPHTWWHWMNGYVSAEGITADLEAMQRTGIGGFQAFHIERKMSPGPVKYMSDEWRRLMTHTIKEADRLGLEMCFHNCAGWSSSGGPWITPEASMMKVAWTEQQVSGPKSVAVQLEKPTGRHKFSRDIAVLAFPTPISELDGKSGFRIENWEAKAGFERDNHIKGDLRNVQADDVIAADAIVDLGGKMQVNGQLNWDAPAGDWTIVRFAYTPTAVRNRPAPQEGRGFECDKLSKTAVDLHWKNTVQKVLDDAGPLAGKVLNNVLVDSYEVMQQNWTKGFESEFRNRMEYDLKAYLPTLTGRVVTSIDVSERFLWDFRRVIADMLTENYYQHFADLCHRNGLQLSIEPYGRPGNLDDFSVADIADIPMGEWWARSPPGLFHGTSKLAASSAHTNGRRIVGAEAFTAGRATAAFVQHPYSLKAQGDYFFCQGVNRVIFHTCVHQPWDKDVLPGMTMAVWGFQNNRNNTWYEQGKAWNEYLARSQHLLQEGTFQADLCYFPGENAPQACPNREDMQPAVPAGYDHDTISRNNFMKLTVQNGRIILPGLMEYQLLVMPAGPVRQDVFEKAISLLNSGAHLVWAKPKSTPGLQNYPQSNDNIRKTANETWGTTDGVRETENVVGQGKVYWPGSLKKILTSLNVKPDVEFHSVQPIAPTLFDGVGYEWIHRKIDTVDVYLISNQQEVARQVEVVFRSEGRVPQFWNAQTGEISQSPVYSFTNDGRTRVKLFMDPAEAVFVVFDQPASSASVVDVLHNGSTPYANKARKPKNLTIIKATYGDLEGDASRQADVTKRLQSKITNNSLQSEVKWKLVGVDPAQGTIKQLKVEYTVGDEHLTNQVKQNEMLVLNPAPEAKHASAEPATLSITGDGGLLEAWEPGEYELIYSNGNRKSLNVASIPESVNLSKDWDLHCPENWGPTEVQLDNLISWTQHSDPDLKYFSGTAVYQKQFDVPSDRLNDNHSVRLDLGDVKLFAEVILNGKNLGALWKPPFQVDATGLLKPTKNKLEIRVTNLWVNRLIGDEQHPSVEKYEPGTKTGELLITKYLIGWNQDRLVLARTQRRLSLGSSIQRILHC